jgi:hypothetical protein
VGTGIDLYRDFDALLIATPNPVDPAVTFVAARHHLTDEEVQAALARGGEAAGRPVTWRKEGGRPVGVRRARRADGDAGVRLERDDRLLLLPGPGLVVIAPPAYATLLMGKREPGGGDGDRDGAEARARRQGDRWRELVAGIDAEDSALPEGAVAMATIANLIGPRRPRGLEVPADVALPAYANAVIATSPLPAIDISLQFERAADARRAEAQLVDLRRVALRQPLLLLLGLTGIISRAEVTRDDAALTVHTTAATQEEMRRILRTIANLLPGGPPPR